MDKLDDYNVKVDSILRTVFLARNLKNFKVKIIVNHLTIMGKLDIILDAVPKRL